MALTDKLIRDKLHALRRELEDISNLSATSREPVALDQQSVGRLSRMDALQGQAMAQASERQRRTEIQRIDAALKRLEDGDYGCCVECGDDIADKRLEIDPAAAMCISCAR
ncbi:TraR/DksA family transcriptional regulator [Roseibium hamelinense]|uniref:TraR/DksA family transcriptional regulator n=1 Tax=Roseibium hamelinense TaxID=150831 RepID=A0A562THD8_9HYPH|nr:TraR/DksA C4-type zinc finger protein [Roseibium hamelinense]MTI45776.1 TraR/DksA family transcriptional regulator [Roseibium hamelinense]TWI93041.1 TraR/DksA family transcriptional regulator [Roseibium hamelinense]